MAFQPLSAGLDMWVWHDVNNNNQRKFRGRNFRVTDF
jgi:hypothetical protein